LSYLPAGRPSCRRSFSWLLAAGVVAVSGLLLVAATSSASARIIRIGTQVSRRAHPLTAGPSNTGFASHHDTSPPLRSINARAFFGPSLGPKNAPPLAPPAGEADMTAVGTTLLGGDVHMTAAATGGLQPSQSPMPATIANFEGIDETGMPPDPAGAAGVNQYVEVVNRYLDVYSKTGQPLLEAPLPTELLWRGFGGSCETPTGSSGDGTVLFDSLAQRWVVEQIGSSAEEPNNLCVAVSASSDATGSWHRYSFEFNGFPDYTKMGVWPNAYFASANVNGSEVCAFERSAMLVGASARRQCFDVPTLRAEPATLDGPTPPPAGKPEWLMSVNYSEVNTLKYWALNVDWTHPEDSTLAGPSVLAVEPFSGGCPGKVECIPQAETTRGLAGADDQLMYRLAYHNFGAQQALVASGAIAAGTSIGMRWYEFRVHGDALSVRQQGTFAPDAAYRWEGSVAMDESDDIGLGYSVSSSSLHPQIRYTGRLATDPLGTMPYEEATLYAGGGSQTTAYRWGDYTEMSIDPVDGCSFWYVNEYIPSNGAYPNTRIGSFRFPGCGKPTATSDPASNVDEHGATVAGSVDPGGPETNYHLEYGPSESYGSDTAPVSLSPGVDPVAVSEALGGLEPGTTYHFRIVATNVNGTVRGPDQSFTTLRPQGLKVTVAGQGLISGENIACDTECNAEYSYGSRVSLEARPSVGFEFAGWNGINGDPGTCTGTRSPCEIMMDATKELGATFVTQVRRLSVVVSGTGTGTVTSAPAGIDCGRICFGTYVVGTAITLNATAGEQSSFAGWSDGGCAGTSACNLLLNSDATVTAVFTASQAPSRTRSGSGRAFVAGFAPVDKGKARLRIRCRGAGDCSGAARLFARLTTKQAMIGRAGYRIRAGQLRVVPVRLSREAQTFLRRNRQLKVLIVGKNLQNRVVRLKPRGRKGGG